MITSGRTIFLVPEKLSTDVRAYFVEQKRRRETPDSKILDESILDSVCSTVYTFVDREKTAEAHISNTTDTGRSTAPRFCYSLFYNRFRIFLNSSGTALRSYSISSWVFQKEKAHQTIQQAEWTR